MARRHISFTLLLLSEIPAGISSYNINWWILRTKFNTWVIIKYCNGLVYRCSWLAALEHVCPKFSIQGTPATVTNWPRLFLVLQLCPYYSMGVLPHWFLLLFLVLQRTRVDMLTVHFLQQPVVLHSSHKWSPLHLGTLHFFQTSWCPLFPHFYYDPPWRFTLIF